MRGNYVAMNAEGATNLGLPTKPSLKYMPTVPIVGMGKEGRTLIGTWGYLNRKLPFIELP